MTINEATRTYRLPNPTTPEDLECRWSKVLNFGDKVLRRDDRLKSRQRGCLRGRRPRDRLGDAAELRNTPIRISAGAALTGLYLVAEKIREGLFFMPFGGDHMARRFLIDRKDLPYDAFVPDPSWLGPIDTEEGGAEDGDPRKKAHADSDQGAGRQSGQTETE